MKVFIDRQFDRYNALIKRLKKTQGSFAIIFFFLFITPFIVGEIINAFI